jgi:carbamoyltransferase
MQAQMNLKIKFREGFRPFAPSVLRERVGQYFDLDRESPYMLLVAPVKKERQIQMSEGERGLWGIEKLNVKRSDIPAVTHIDYSARIQTVARETNPDYYELIKEFEALTGYGVIVNTSFNVRGEPIVCSPEDAYRCFMRTQMDYLVLGPFLLAKTDQPEWKEADDWRKEFQLD